MRFCLLIVWLCLVFSAKLHAQENSLTFGVVPQQSPKKLAQNWQPLLDYISQYTGLKIDFKTAKDIPTFEANLEKGAYDIAYMNPYHFVVFHDAVNYRALARQKDTLIKGIIVVPKDSKVQSLDDLNGAEIAFPAPAAFAASIITSAALHKRNVAFVPRYVNSHDSVYLAVQHGFFSAGGGIARTLNKAPSQVKNDLKVLWESNGYTPHAIATKPNMAQSHRQAILKALLALTHDSSNAWILENLGFKGFIESVDSDWDDVRELGIMSLSRPHI
ncbi:phosphate/phosphite/phosphonate ABC transporter substrate-binding protein [Alteromonas sp. D210916BOD_24]|uniref:phosphate/phosphite/phosphonate ABC transporter substrate-binding protein n=1 Tax=Alteromonas sp. D210916BOD_24 TaxID=3157618 RepID=UPI00399CB020